MPRNALFPRQRLAPASRAVAPLCLSLMLAWPLAGHAGVALLQPPRVIDGNQPLTLTLVVSADNTTRRYRIPDTLEVTASGDLLAPVRLVLWREVSGPAVVNLRRGEHRAIRYTVALPPVLRGHVRLDATGIDAAPVLVTLNRLPQPGETATSTPPVASQAPATVDSAESADSAPVPVTGITTAEATAPAPADLRDSARLSFHDPMYFLAGAHGGANAKFQFSFKYRIFEGEDPASKRLFDNLYFSYTQFSLWDLSEDSAPFRDTNYRPSLFYYLSDTGVRNSVISRMSLATGLEHESNGRNGVESRSINTVFVKPTFYFGDQNDWHWRVAPKLYAYVEKADNPDIAHYRGFMDLGIAYGRPDSWELSATLRKGTRKWYGSVDAQLTYPMARLIPGTAGYLMAGYFVGYGESLLDYNHKLPWQFRIGYALTR
ncbi:phospholipase A [Cupriavidus alkaliphilus]|uniref:Phospholipase A1 n=1 Tax=Cupriavidus alkaliphilus TaxID=942866 RepID=A0A7W4VAV4_9BURK|nr:phospholipase A [Cupriavidus alkaliphilus]MBB3008239.1 outer membrane phospholipase A [Cupriavidus alkaliphilus]PVY78587.1 phospholipase A1-like protein [Cupriavidus alkaliphilus]SCB25055.1 Phospholipase A1 [Cupriavidus alkaliphilus]